MFSNQPKSTTKKIIILILFLTTKLNYSQSLDNNNKALEKKIDKYLTEGQAKGFSGAVLIAKNGKILLNKGYGIANREKKEVITSETVFSTGSVTKQFTAAAVLKLVELDKLKLTDKLATFFKNLPEDKKNITIHQLLIHASGLVGGIGIGDFEDISTNNFFKTLFNTKLRYKSGTKHRYSNAGYSVLARIIELVSKQEYEEFLLEHLFKPSGMMHTGYLMPKWENKKLANGYVNGIINWGAMIPRFQKAGNISWALKGNGGIQSTSEDMYKWYQALNSNLVLSKSSIKLLTTPYIKEQEGSDLSHYAYGWAIFNSDRKTKIVTHNGSNGIFFHEFMWLPEEDTVLIFFTNAYSREVEIIWQLEKMLFAQNYSPKPIQKSPYLLVLDFIDKNNVNQSKELLSLIKQKYGSDFSDSNVLNQIGYMLLERNQSSNWMIELFKLNVRLFPDNANLWDSLGDGYKSKNDTKNAIKSYKKALELDPTITTSIKSLKELGIVYTNKTPKTINISKSILKNYVGEYRLKSGHLIKVLIKQSNLYIEFPGRPLMQLIPKSETKFSIANRNASLMFMNNATDINSFTITENGEQMIAKKLIHN
ncbi:MULTISPECIES: serine hydrolase domain-containing protein [unclassified Tenacibaculum]|uniref:serine hydrolase domain-containing protein n=1 Tax=unclassified Tenacibaculum TaxID=2635139 RepID=UPI001F3BEBB2|nr:MULTISPECIES: serine hydrolase [unclassified Tenacibaculum]MCF2875731.1 serine hydrolase [Tenacibaculum sp. Cn5-1]MCF2935807.1 serine hydrolase [Tenacibaculum sp. Cn5-34]MCG7512367.1 serine hydrolase [Tenacibaculum sp. Cn5-46]